MLTTNPILNYRESILIFTHITSVIKFLQLIEAGQKAGNASGR